MKKKIAFLSHLDLNLYLFRLPIMKELVKKGYEVYAICPKGEVFDKFSEYGIKAIAYEIDRGSLNPFKELKSIYNIYKAIKPLQLDIIHTFTAKPNIYGTIAARFARIGVIYNLVEGLGSFYIDNDLKSKMVRFIIELLYKKVFKYSNLVFFVNFDDPKYLVQRNIISQKKVKVIKSVGIDTNEFKPIQKPQNKKPIVLMIARVIKDKGVEEFIKAANLLKDKAEFWYVGDIDKGNKNAFNPEWKNVKYLGFRSDIKELISKCDIFVLPSYREGVPRTLLEASSMAKPIVTTDAVGCREVVEDNKNGFLVPIKDYKTLANKIEILIDNPKLREEFGKYGRIKTKKEFDIKVVVKKYIEVYEGLECIKK